MKRIDLHAHTHRSDGTLTPTALVELAAEIGLAALAVTDHDTTVGLEEAIATGKRVGVEVLVGCEISTRIASGVVHVLAWGFDREDHTFQAFLDEVWQGRERRNAKMLARLAELNLPLTHEEVARHAYGHVVARPHFALAMVERGYVRDAREAFQRYLSDTGPAYVLAEMPHPTAAVRAVRAAGGVSSVAHPKQIRLDGRASYAALFSELKAAGLNGIEIDHPSHNLAQREMFRSLADELDLVPTGGSDFHGTNKPHISLGSGDGSIEVLYETWERLRERLPR
ncbi:MAG: PHP domain-containing protein [Planctomycetota bacterium]|jgi:predicted metal-dependent phosphoesterase TrpH